MTKETVMAIFNAHKTTNFCITTNIAEGRGINGVSFGSFEGESLVKKEYHDEYYHASWTKILGFMDECIVLCHYENHSYWDGGEHIYYIPYSNIVSISFREKDTPAYPIKMMRQHNLKEIK